MRDSWGDEIYVYKDGFGVILHSPAVPGRSDMSICLTKKQAKDLGKLLLKATRGAKAVKL